MIPLQEAGAQTIADSWNALAPARYRLDPLLVAQNLLDHPLLHETASWWHEDAFIAVKRSASGLYEGPDSKTAHLSLMAWPEGIDVLGPVTQAFDILRAEGIETVVVGMDSGHFLPGAPTDVPWLGRRLKEIGFAPGGLAFDLERGLRDFTTAPLVPGEYRRLRPDDVPLLDAFLLREFPGRWRFDTMRKIEAEGASTVFGLFLDGACEGFALLQSEGCAFPTGGAVWKADLGSLWGALGPIGVSKTLRGQGYGYALLSAALAELRDSGARRTIIDWTGLVDFYGTQGFSVARAYRSYRFDLAADRRPSA